MDTRRMQSRWYVAYTHRRAERVADQKLKQMGITSFLPLHKVMKQWCDRKKRIEVPLFPNYIFINSLPHQRFNAFQVKELVRFVSFEGQPAIISDGIIESLQNILKDDVEVSTGILYREGMKVKIREGRFAGAEGILVKKNGNTRFLVQIEALHTQVSINIPANVVESLPIQTNSRLYQVSMTC